MLSSLLSLVLVLALAHVLPSGSARKTKLHHESLTKVLVTNDDGWAEANIRALFDAVTASGRFDAILSAPAENESGTGSSDAPPTLVGSSGCEFDTCPAGAPATGNNASDIRLNYVNSFPVTSVHFGLSTLAPVFFGSAPDIVLSGPNVGNNLGTTVLISGTVGAATGAAIAGVPAIAFSGDIGDQVSFTILSSNSTGTDALSARVFAALALKLTDVLLASPTRPVLPANISLNVNFPAISSACASTEDFKFVLTRINANASATDVETCGTDQLPTETSVIGDGECLNSVSVMNATTKGDVDAATQAFVLKKLSSILTCA